MEGGSAMNSKSGGGSRGGGGSAGAAAFRSSCWRAAVAGASPGRCTDDSGEGPVGSGPGGWYGMSHYYLKLLTHYLHDIDLKLNFDRHSIFYLPSCLCIFVTLQTGIDAGRVKPPNLPKGQ